MSAATTIIAASAITAAVASIGSAGISFYGQQQQAAAASRMAQYNYAVAQQQAQLQAQAAQYQAELSYRQSQMAADAAQAQYQAQFNNAAQYDQQALRVEQEARERARRMRSENERMLGEQRARYGKAGVTSAGSPLTVMAETAGLLELGVADELYKADMERSAFYRKGEAERYQAGFSLLDKAAAEYEMAASRFQGNAARQGYALAMNTARGERMATNNQASALRMGSYGSLLQGAGDVANMGFNYGVYSAGGSSRRAVP
jgi:DNA primase